MIKPYVEIEEDGKIRRIYKKLYCHSFPFVKDIDDDEFDHIYLNYIITNNKKIGGGVAVVYKEKGIREHFEDIKKQHGEAYLDVIKFDEEHDTIDIYFEAY